MTLTPNLIACLAIGGAGILTALLSIPFFRHTGMLRRKCSARTTGTVIRYRLQRRGSGCGTSIAPVVEFQAAGETYCLPALQRYSCFQKSCPHFRRHCRRNPHCCPERRFPHTADRNGSQSGSCCRRTVATGQHTAGSL